MKHLFEVDEEEKGKLEAALEILRQERISIIDALRNGIIIFDESGRVVAVNQKWTDIFKLGIKDLDGYNILSDPLTPQTEHSKVIFEAYEGEPIAIPDHIFTPEKWGWNAPPRWTKGLCIPVYEDGNISKPVIACICIEHDALDSRPLENEVCRISQALTELTNAHNRLLDQYQNLQVSLKKTYVTRPKSMPPLQTLLELAPQIPRREKEVFEKLATGYSVKETAHNLDLGVKSVYTYRARLLARLRLDSDVQIAIAWREIADHFKLNDHKS